MIPAVSVAMGQVADLLSDLFWNIRKRALLVGARSVVLTI